MREWVIAFSDGSQTVVHANNIISVLHVIESTLAHPGMEVISIKLRKQGSFRTLPPTRQYDRS